MEGVWTGIGPTTRMYVAQLIRKGLRGQVALFHSFPVVSQKVALLALGAVENHEVNSHTLSLKAIQDGLEDSLLPFVKHIMVAEARAEHKLPQTGVNRRGDVCAKTVYYVLVRDLFGRGRRETLSL